MEKQFLFVVWSKLLKSSLETKIMERGVFVRWNHWIFILIFSSPLVFANQGPGVLLDRANALYQQSRFTQAIILYQKALLRGADPVAVSFNIGNSYYQLEKYPESLAAFRKSVDFSKGSFVPAIFNLASVYFRLKLYPESIAAYQRGLDIEPNHFSAWLFLGEAYHKIGDPVGALRAFNKAYELDPLDISVIYQVSEAYIALEEFEKATDLVRKAFHQIPEEVDFLIYLGDIERLQKNMDAAASAYREALHLNPNQVDLLYKLADVLAENKQEYMAMEILNEALQIDSTYSDAAIFLGNLAYELRWWERAEEAYEQAAKLKNPEALYGLKNLAYEAQHSKNTKEALRLLKKTLFYYPQDASIQAEILNWND